MIVGSLWHDLTQLPAPARTPLPPECRVAIIGGGITGAATAYHLAHHGIGALVIEREHLAWGATGRNAGFLLGGTVEYFHEAVRTWGFAEAVAIWAFTLENNRGIKNAILREGIDCNLQIDGQTILASDDAEYEALRETVKLLKDTGLETTLLDAHGAEERTGLRRFRGARLQADDAILNPAALVLGLANAAVVGGATIATGQRVEAIAQVDDRWAITTTDSTTYAQSLVLASNAWIPLLWPAYSDLITPVRAQALATAPVAPGLMTGALSTNYGYEYWRQTPGGHVLLGGKRWTEHDHALNTLDQTPQEATHNELVAFLHEHYPALREVPVTHRWAGLMAFSKDHLPLIGPLPGARNAYLSGGYTGHGMAFGYLAGRVLADLIATGETPLDVKRYSPSRFSPQ